MPSDRERERVLLIDIDSKIPDLALMKVSAYHKAQGDAVGFDTADPTRAYISCIFKKNKAKAMRRLKRWANQKQIFWSIDISDYK